MNSEAFVELTVSSLFPILRLPYITTNSALGLSNLWLRSESSLCLLMNTLMSIILGSVLSRIREGVGSCLYMFDHMIDRLFVDG